jgi:hypothetical protein
MCDYSLMGVSNRLACTGEELVTYRFNRGTIGLISRADLPVPAARTFWATVKDWLAVFKSQPMCAVCVPPGAQLMIPEIPESLQRELKINSAELATFTQVNCETYSHRDAVMFPNGRTLLLQRLGVGLCLQVLSLSSREVMPFRESFEEEVEVRSTAVIS